MTLRLPFLECFINFLLIYSVAFSQNEFPPRPTFPDVFQVDIEGLLQEEETEVDASFYYDRPNNRAVLTYTYQKDTTTSIFNFNDNQLVYIEGVDCSVSEITKDSGLFISYKENRKTKKKTINSPEEIFFFTKSVFAGQGIAQFPSYIYTAKLNIKLSDYELPNCVVDHVFSKPEEQKPDCDGHLCKPTLVTISVKCPTPSEDEPDISHIYNFYRFKFAIKDESVFQPPIGVHCDIKSQKPFPAFPPYFSFSYDIVQEQKNTDEDPGAISYFKRVWYDTKLNLIRMDEFNENGLLLSSRIFDFYGRVAYTTVTSAPECEPSDLPENVDLGEMTRLPNLLVAKNQEKVKNLAYIGKRNNYGLHYDVWTQSIKGDKSEAKYVYEYYFVKNNRKENESLHYLQLSHVHIYTYERDDQNNGQYELDFLTYISISNFRSKPKEWEAFDISSCFTKEEKKGFSLKVDGPPIIKGSPLYEEILEKLYTKLIILTNVSVIRINKLEGQIDGMHISEFSGWILNKIQSKDSKVKNEEPNMEETYKMIEKAADAGKLTIKMKRNDEVQEYKITSITEKVESSGGCISGRVFAIVSVILLFMGITFGFVGYHVFLKRKNTQKEDKMQLDMVNEM